MGCNRKKSLKKIGFYQRRHINANKTKKVIKLIEETKADIVIYVALPFQDLTIMDAVFLRRHPIDTANYEHPDTAKFEYKEQWARDAAFESGIMGLLGSTF